MSKVSALPPLEQFVARVPDNTNEISDDPPMPPQIDRVDDEESTPDQQFKPRANYDESLLNKVKAVSQSAEIEKARVEMRAAKMRKIKEEEEHKEKVKHLIIVGLGGIAVFVVLKTVSRFSKESGGFLNFVMKLLGFSSGSSSSNITEAN